MTRSARRKKSNLYRGIQALCLLVLAGGLVYLGKYMWASYQNQQDYANLTSIWSSTPGDGMQTPAPTVAVTMAPTQQHTQSPIQTPVPTQTPRPLQLNNQQESLLQINPDFVGWLNIPGTKVDYPVVQGSDNDHYLDHDFYGKESNYGTVFLDERADLTKPSSNLMLYGHNMKDGQMFHNLRYYRQKDFWQKNRYAYFHTIYGVQTYEIFAAYIVDLEKEGVTTAFFDIVDGDLQPVLDEARVNQLFDSGVEVSANDAILTLVTCTYEYNDARLIVLARQIEG